MAERRYNSLDLFKLVMAICVVAIHTNPMADCTNGLANVIYSEFVELAVPFFFLSSGFLLGKKMEYPFTGEQNEAVIKKYLLKIIKMYLVWTAVYFPLALYHYTSEGTEPIRAVLLYIRGLIFTGEHYNSWPLWYLLSTIYALLLLLFLLRRKTNFKAILFIGGIIFVISIAITCLTEFEGNLPTPILVIQMLLKYSLGKGRILTGMFYIPVGMLLSKKRLPIWVSWIMLIAVFGINVAISNYYISTILTALCVIGFFGVAEAIHFPDSKVFPFVRKMSTVVYFIHMYVWSIYYKLVYGEKTYGLDCFLVTSCICIAIAFVYVGVSDRLRRRKAY